MPIIKTTTGGTGGGGGAAFTTIQTDSGTDPVATGPNDVLTLTSPVFDVAGNSTTDTVTFNHKAEVNHGAAGSTETIDFNAGPAHYFDVDADCTLTLSNPQSGGAYVILIEANGTNEVLWPSVTWLTPGGVAPDISALANGDLCAVNLYYSGSKSAYIGTYAIES
jgi:hypothetical protein